MAILYTGNIITKQASSLFSMSPWESSFSSRTWRRRSPIIMGHYCIHIWTEQVPASPRSFLLPRIGRPNQANTRDPSANFISADSRTSEICRESWPGKWTVTRPGPGTVFEISGLSTKMRVDADLESSSPSEQLVGSHRFFRRATECSDS
jgi:hypothetical protein